MKTKNINKKLLAGLISAVMITTPLGLTACELPHELHYDNNSYDYVSTLKVVEIETLNSKSIWLTSNNNYGYKKDYFDSFSGQQIFSTEEDSVVTSGVKLIREENFNEYLITYNRVQKSYSKDELEEIVNQIKQDVYSNEKDKELVKK